MEEKKFDEIPGKIDPDAMRAAMEDMMKARKEYEDKYRDMFRWKTGEMFYVTVIKEEPLEAKPYDHETRLYLDPRIFNYVLTFDRSNWCIHKGQLVIEDEGYVGKIISIEIR